VPSFFIQTLGCKLNQLESEAITDAFSQAGFVLSSQADSSPSVIVINTCTVTSKADQKARRVIRKALHDYPDSRVLVTGCYAQLAQDELYKLETDGKKRLFVLKGINKDDILNLPKYLDNSDINGALKKLTQTQKAEGKERNGIFQFNPSRFSGHTRSFLKIQDGCNEHCTYCRIRLARGASVSLDAEEVLSRLRILEQNHAEAVLTGVNISQYNGAGINGNSAFNLAQLLEYLLSGTEKIAIRLSSLAPDRIDESLAKILSHKRIRPHFHLSVQSGSKKILEKMNRSYNGETIEKAVSLLRRAKDDPFLACDIITGFPGETTADFEETFNLCKKINFSWIHVFPYSRRPGTPAYLFTDNVHSAKVTKRVQLFTDLARQGRADYVRRWLGREVDVLIEKAKTEKFSCRGISENYLKTLVRCNGETLPPGTVVRCNLLEEGNFEDFDVVAVGG
jgi:threonylcarbamoyladenosine tRNA methylthiotransferase MtaB